MAGSGTGSESDYMELELPYAGYAATMTPHQSADAESGAVDESSGSLWEDDNEEEEEPALSKSASSTHEDTAWSARKVRRLRGVGVRHQTARAQPFRTCTLLPNMTSAGQWSPPRKRPELAGAGADTGVIAGRVQKRTQRRVDRAMNACKHCHNQHVACTGGRPCERCRKFHRTCVELHASTKRAPPAAIDTLDLELERLEVEAIAVLREFDAGRQAMHAVRSAFTQPPQPVQEPQTQPVWMIVPNELAAPGSLRLVFTRTHEGTRPEFPIMIH